MISFSLFIFSFLFGLSCAELNIYEFGISATKKILYFNINMFDLVRILVNTSIIETKEDICV